MIKKYLNFLIVYLLLLLLAYSLFYNNDEKNENFEFGPLSELFTDEYFEIGSLFFDKDGEYKNCESWNGDKWCTVKYFEVGKLMYVKIYLNDILVEEHMDPSSIDSNPIYNEYGMQHMLYYDDDGNLQKELRTFGDTMFYEKMVYNSTEADSEVSYDSYSGYEETYTYHERSDVKILQKKYDKAGKLIYDESGFNWDEKGDLLEISNYASIDNDLIIQEFLNEMAQIKKEKLVLTEKNIKNVSFSTMTDSRDGNSYKTITIGDQTWMAENLAHKPEGGVFSTLMDINSKRNYLYSWNTAIKVCPTGWHLPNNKDWNQFSEMLGGIEVAGVKIKSKTGWKDNGNGTNDIGFNAYPVVGNIISWWSSTQNYKGEYSFDVWKSAYTYKLFTNSDALYFNSNEKENKNSVRCIKD